MSYYVLKKDADEAPGKTTLFDGVLYYATFLSPPTEFKSEEEARRAIEASMERFKNAKFRIIE